MSSIKQQQLLRAGLALALGAGLAFVRARFFSLLLPAAAVCALALVLVPQKETALEFLLFFGIYPMLKLRMERHPSPVACWACKLLFCNVMLAVGYGLCLLLGIPMEEMGGQLPVMLLALNAVFVLYDCCFTRVMRTVMRRYRKLFLND